MPIEFTFSAAAQRIAARTVLSPEESEKKLREMQEALRKSKELNFVNLGEDPTKTIPTFRPRS